MKMLISFLAVISTCGFAQKSPVDISSSEVNSLPKVALASFLPLTRIASSVQTLDSPVNLASDSVYAHRSFISTTFYQHGTALSNQALLNLYQTVPSAKKAYYRGRTLKIVGLLTAAGGITLGYVALKGKDKSITAGGQDYPYTIRSVPELLAGLGALVGGMCLIEFSNEAMVKSAHLYNAQLRHPSTAHFFKTIKLGIMPSGSIGLYARF